jgi:hypothetical protein
MARPRREERGGWAGHPARGKGAEAFHRKRWPAMPRATTGPREGRGGSAAAPPDCGRGAGGPREGRRRFSGSVLVGATRRRPTSDVEDVSQETSCRATALGRSERTWASCGKHRLGQTRFTGNVLPGNGPRAPERTWAFRISLKSVPTTHEKARPGVDGFRVPGWRRSGTGAGSSREDPWLPSSGPSPAS